MPSPTTRVGAGVFLVSAALMTAELVVTRIFSLIVWYHFAFLAISVALFGMGVSALGVHLLQDRITEERTTEALSLSSLALAASVVVLDLCLVHFTPDWFGGSQHTQLTTKLAALFVLSATPFVCGGFALSLAIARNTGAVHRLYFLDLLGAGASCLLVIPLLGFAGGPLALLASSALGCLGALAFAGVGAPKRTRALAIGLLAGLALLGATARSTGLFRVRFAKGFALDVVRPELNRWNSFSVVSVFPDLGFRGWGLSPKYRGAIPEQKTLVIDMNAMTTLTRFQGSFDDVRYASHDLSAFVFRVRPAPAKVCVVGAGGGKDVLAALASGARQVTAVEVNPLIVDGVMRGRYRDFTGHLYERDDVRVVNEDGRTFVRRTDERFEVVHLAMVDTSAATAAGAYALTENSLYTADAFRDFTSRLAPGGVLSVASVSMPGLAVGARLSAIARASVRSAGADPARSVAVLSTPWVGLTNAIMYDVLVSPAGFGEADVARIDAAARELGFQAVYLPGRKLPAAVPEDAVIAQILTSGDDGALARELAKLPLDVSATTDDRPFFFYQNRISDLAEEPSHMFGNGLFILVKVAAVAFAMVALFLALPMLVNRRHVRAGRGAPLADVAYVASLGLGFMFLEMGLVLRFSVYLGHPTATLSVVLLVLLSASAFGSRLFARADAAKRRRITVVLIGIVLCALLLAFGLPRALDASAGLSAALRALLVGAMLIPVGLLVGAPLPAALGSVGDRAPTRVAWLWSVNSGTSVLGSVLATLVAMHAGIAVTLVVGGALYAVAAALAPRVLAGASGPGDEVAADATATAA